MSDLFFGFDLSTQQLKLLITDSQLAVHSTHSIEFDKDFPAYKTHKGVYSNEQTGEINAPVSMWIEALDLTLNRLQKANFPFERVKGISGSCQQHGSVYWSELAHTTLSQLKPNQNLANQISADNFSLQTAPNWQDHSTGEEIAKFEEYVGGSEELARLTGSRAHYRFTGLQIRKIKKLNKEAYEKTDRISLVSSFLASLFLGSITGIEESDACGMNLYDIGQRDWNDELLSIASLTHEKDGGSSSERSEAVAALRSKLGPVVKAGYESIGSINAYFAHKYGFSSNTKIYSFTGDNPATILSLPLDKDEYLVSLGTSTTVLLVTDKYIPSPNYHLFIHPTIPDAYMGMICYCNGSLAREKVRDQLNGDSSDGSWEKFNEILDKSVKFDNRLGIYFPLGEIVPNAPAQTIRANYIPETGSIEPVASWDISEDVSSIVESQALSCRARASAMLSIRDTTAHDNIKSLEFDDKVIDAQQLNQKPNKVIFVGGASKNKAIVSKFSSILGSLKGNFRYDNSNACAIGGAFKAHWSYTNETSADKVGFHEFLANKFNWTDLETIEAADEWESYVLGVNTLNLLENGLDK